MLFQTTLAHAAQSLPQAESPKTDFMRHSEPFGEIISCGPPSDGIPPTDRPRFVKPAETARWLLEAEPVIVFTHGAETRAYPLRIMTCHEIVNDTVGGLPVAITSCP